MVPISRRAVMRSGTGPRWSSVADCLTAASRVPGPVSRYCSQARSRALIDRNGECEVSGVLTRVRSQRSVKGQVEK